MDRLAAHEGELKALGLSRLALFGSTARDEAGEDSDVDVAVRLEPSQRIGLFGYAAIRERLSEVLDTQVDMVSEPARKARLQAAIDRDRVHVF